MAKWKSVTGLYPVGHLPNTELVGVKRGNTYYARSYVIPANPKTDRQRVVRAAHMVIGNALYRMSKDPAAREWKKPLTTITGVNDIRRAWISLVAKSYNFDSGTFQFPPEFAPVENGAVGADTSNICIMADLDGSELEVIAYAAIQPVSQNMGGSWVRTVDVPVPVRVHEGTTDWLDAATCTELGNKYLLAISNEELGDAFVGIFFVKVLAESWEFWSPNGTVSIHPVRFGYVANLAPGKDLFCYFGPGGVVHQDWTNLPASGMKYVPLSAPHTLSAYPDTYPYSVYKVQADIIDSREPQTCRYQTCR